MESFRERIKELRLRSGKSQQDVAKDLGVSQVTVFKLETGKVKVKEEHLQKFAELYNTSVEELLSDNFLDKCNYTDSARIDLISATPCCGNGVETEEQVVGTFKMPIDSYRTLSYASPDKVKLLQVVGDSMKPTINDSDFVMVDTSVNNIGDGIFVIRTLAGLAVKRIQIGIDKVSIISDNPMYQPLNASAGEIKIIGKVIKIFNIVTV